MTTEYWSGEGNGDEPEDSEGAFIAECASRCRCCTDCGQQFPCAGVMQGASCDGMCRCDDDQEDW